MANGAQCVMMHGTSMMPVLSADRLALTSLFLHLGSPSLELALVPFTMTMWNVMVLRKDLQIVPIMALEVTTAFILKMQELFVAVSRSMSLLVDSTVHMEVLCTTILIYDC